MKRSSSILTVFAMAAFALSTQAAVMVGGEEMFPSRNIIDNAVQSKDHTTLVAAVKAAALVETLQGPGPFTVFAPTDAAFAKLPAGTVDGLLEPANKPALTGILTYHVVADRLDFKSLLKKIKAGDGEAVLTTVNGETLIAVANGPHNIAIRDGQGNVTNISTYDVFQSNGVIHVIDSVLLPL